MAAFKSILVAGDTGSFGQEFVRTLLDRRPEAERIVATS
jgi:FlaA1/EpsC-like NDP-sugar epimerase